MMKALSINFITCGLLVLSILFTPTNTDGQQKSSKLDNQKIEKFRRLERQYEGFPEMIRSFKAAWLTSMGNYYGEKGNLDKAISSFNEAISIKNDFTPAYISLGIACREKGMHQEALALLNKAPRKVRINGKELGGYEFDLCNVITSVYLAMGNKPKALEYAKKALEAVNDPKRKEQIEASKRAGIITEKENDDPQVIQMVKELIQELEAE